MSHPILFHCAGRSRLTVWPWRGCEHRLPTLKARVPGTTRGLLWLRGVWATLASEKWLGSRRSRMQNVSCLSTFEMRGGVSALRPATTDTKAPSPTVAARTCVWWLILASSRRLHKCASCRLSTSPSWQVCGMSHCVAPSSQVGVCNQASTA
jgi:hypothetical protein